MAGEAAPSSSPDRPGGLSSLAVAVLVMANLWGFALLGFGVWYASHGRDGGIAPQPQPSYSLAARLDAAMTPAGNADALDAARLWAAMADAVEADGRAPTPKLVTVGHLYETIRIAGLLAWQPPFSSRYPATEAVLAEHLKPLGKAPDVLDRARAAALLRETGKAFEEAGR